MSLAGPAIQAGPSLKELRPAVSLPTARQTSKASRSCVCRGRWEVAAATLAFHRILRRSKGFRQLEAPGASFYRFRSGPGAGRAPAGSELLRALEASEDFFKAMDPQASLQSMEAAVASLCAGYSAGCVLAICAAVRHRWQHLPKEERGKILLVLRILRLLDASAPALAAAALAAGSVPVLGAKAGIERKQVEAAFGSKVALLLVELQQLATITRTFEAEARESGGLSPGQADLVQTLLTAQRTQSSSSETLIIFLAKKAAQLRHFAFRLGGARRGSDSASPEHLVAAALGTEVFGSLANLLGLGRIKDELEDAAFAISHPEERAELRVLLGERQGEMLVNTATRELQEALEASQLKELSSLRVSGRAKSAYSTWKKMNKKNLRFHEIWDRMAIRVILDAPSAERARQLCFEVRDVVAGLWKLMEGRSKDYVSNPKANGYRSIHLVATREGEHFEVQIRTQEMHRQAEYGSCGHWEYKAGGRQVGMTDAAANAGAELFAGIDADGNGRIDARELERALRRVGVEASQEQVHDMLEVFDSDQDGSVDFKDFWKALVTTWFPLVSGTHLPRKRTK